MIYAIKHDDAAIINTLPAIPMIWLSTVDTGNTSLWLKLIDLIIDVELSFISTEAIENQRLRLSKSYTSDLDFIVEDILKNHIGTSKDLFINNTSNLYY